MSEQVVLVGNIKDGLKAYGPFISNVAADKWAQGHHAHEEWLIMDLTNPFAPPQEEKRT